MGSCINFQEEEKSLDKFQIENGILGAKRYILMRLIDLMMLRDSLIRNLIGMSGESVCWINHFHFTVARTFRERHLEKHIIPSKRERGKEITIKFRNIIFNLSGRTARSIFINILIKNTILECIIKINRGSGSAFYVGICTPKEVNYMVLKSYWEGGSFFFDYFSSRVLCSGSCSYYLKEEGIKNEEEITTVVNNKNVNNKGGKMNIIRNQKRVPHTIMNIPKDGVHFGFCSKSGSITFTIISFTHISVLPPPFNDGMRCIAYNFFGGFGFYTQNHQDEEGKEIPNIWDYYNDDEGKIRKKK